MHRMRLRNGVTVVNVLALPPILKTAASTMDLLPIQRLVNEFV
jgi:hypothetical protein